MILTDTGPLVALLDSQDPNHVACRTIALHLPPTPLITTWPCFTEAMYLLGSAGGYRYQAQLWRMCDTQRLTFHDLSTAEVQRMAALMDRYRNVPMELAEASLVVAAESLSLRQIFSLDSDFYIYRLADGTALNVLR